MKIEKARLLQIPGLIQARSNSRIDISFALYNSGGITINTEF